MESRLDKLTKIYYAWVDSGHKPSYASPSDMMTFVNVYHELLMNKKAKFLSTAISRIFKSIGFEVVLDSNKVNYIVSI